MPRLLAIYLNDHLAGATAGLELARRAAASNEGTALGERLASLARELDEDRETLRAIMERLDVGEDRLKRSAGWVAEKVGRLKPNGQIVGYSPLSRMIELEGLHVGISGKLSLWQVLRETAGGSLAEFELEELIARAERQRGEVEPLRLEAAGEAFAAERPADAPEPGSRAG
jgi:hypothetical protein